MTDAPGFLSVDDVLAIHRRMMAEFGGEASIRDRGLLESAVRMPAARFEQRFLHDGIPEMAAAYLFHLRKNHAFVDGNKRTALASSEVFLLLNRMELTAGDEQAEELTRGVAEGRLSKQAVTAFFREHAAVADS